MNIDFPNMFDDMLLNQMSSGLILLITSIVFLFRFFSFINASVFEQQFENKFSKLLREFYFYNLLFVLFLLFSLNFPPVIFRHLTAFFVITLLIFLLNIVIMNYNKSKLLVKLFTIKKVVNLKLFKKLLLVLNIVTVLFFYVIVISAIASAIKSNLNLNSSSIIYLLIDTFKTDIYLAISFLIICYISYIILRVYLTPVIEFYKSISPDYSIEIHLTNNEILKFAVIVETFDNYYVFSNNKSNKNNIKDKTIVPKDKIQYIRFLPADKINIIN